VQAPVVQTWSVRGRDGDRAATRQGVPGIDAEVQYNEFEFTRTNLDGPQVRREAGLDLDVAPQRAVEQFAHGVDLRPNVDWLGPELLTARERQELAGERGSALDSLVHAVDQPLTTTDGIRLTVKHFEPARENLEQVVEVVGDTAGELANGLHLLRLAQLLGGAPLLGDVTPLHNEVAWMAGAVENRLDREVDDRAHVARTAHLVLLTHHFARRGTADRTADRRLERGIVAHRRGEPERQPNDVLRTDLQVIAVWFTSSTVPSGVSNAMN
jgi:hypothetical protein